MKKDVKKLLLLLTDSFSKNSEETKIASKLKSKVEINENYISEETMGNLIVDIVKKRFSEKMEGEDLCVYIDLITVFVLQREESGDVLMDEEQFNVVSKLLGELSINPEDCHHTLLSFLKLFQSLPKPLISSSVPLTTTLLTLLSTTQSPQVISCLLSLLAQAAKNDNLLKVISEFNSVEILLLIIKEQAINIKKQASDILLAMMEEGDARQMVNICDGVHLLLTQLKEPNVKLVFNVLWCLVKLTRDKEVANDFRAFGGIPLLLSILPDQNFHPKHQANLQDLSYDQSIESRWDRYLSLKSACVNCLTELAIVDNNAFVAVQNNALYLLSLFLLPPSTFQKLESEKKKNEHDFSAMQQEQIAHEWLYSLPKDNQTVLKSYQKLQTIALRCLRFLFSVERIRGKFKRLLLTSMIPQFIDVGQYNRDLTSYQAIINSIYKLNEDDLQQLKENILSSNNNKAPIRTVGEYMLTDVLGTGAFGTVYKGCKSNQPFNVVAIKEIADKFIGVGKNSVEKEREMRELNSELNVIKEKLNHENIVRYYRTFVFDRSLFIVMELVEGCSLTEVVQSTKEKSLCIEENRIWNIFIQLSLGLRYLHKDKRIVHRDLSPNNVMLGVSDRLVITDFGLAKQKSADNSKMLSVVGSILYSSPELVKNEEYGEKVDVWAMGCLIYLLCSLQPPFNSSNMLALVEKIVEADYSPINPALYSEKLRSIVDFCLTRDQDQRPDIVALVSRCSEVLMMHLDEVRLKEARVRRKLQQEIDRKNSKSYDSECLSLSQSRDACHSNIVSPTFHKQNWSSRESLKSSKTRQPLTLLSQISPSIQSSSSSLTSLSTNKLYNDTQMSNDITSKYNIKTSQNESSPTHHHPLPPSLPPIIRSAPLNINNPRLLKRDRSLDFRKIKSASAALPISSDMIRSTPFDPILQLLTQLHKIVCLTQKPLPSSFDPKRKLIEDFKKDLFSSESSPMVLKKKLCKLMVGSEELIDLPVNRHLLKQLIDQQQYNNHNYYQGMKLNSTGGITYELLSLMIEQLLKESSR